MLIGIAGALGARSGVPPLILDTFSRADNASSLGSAETGQAWTARVGTWGVSGGKAYQPGGTSEALASLNSGASDYTATVDVTWQNAEGLLLRYVDTNNYLFADIHSTGARLVRKLTGSTSVLATGAFTPVAGTTYVLRARVVGSQVTVWVDGVERISTTDSNFLTSTRQGLRAHTATTARLDNFRVTR